MSINSLQNLRFLVRYYLTEGGLKLPPEDRRELTPETVLEAKELYLSFIAGFNSWLRSQNISPINPVSLTGSSIYAPKDRENKERQNVTYGDIDYLVSFPTEYTTGDLTSRRKQESESVKKYTELLEKYIQIKRPNQLDVEKTLRSNVLMVIIRIPAGGFVQVDTVVTHPPYEEWMKGRYTPQRGVKGYVTGNLYKALGDYFTLTIGTEGVLARYKDKERVSSKVRKDVTIKSVSTNFKNFLMDIAEYMTGGDFTPDPLLLQHPGMDPENVSVSSLALGIAGLAKTLEERGILSSSEMLSKIYESFIVGLEENVGKKVTKDITQSQHDKLMKINQEQSKIVKDIFTGV